ncbi:hypothetical protein B0H17DRAFT_1134780 [Mycena rosella]|uniref:Uncharacterized protein n=1 Tax=Mycena rosella TaxID=1033263 RepID=A0AAD7GDQ8_MYCRO|nr:hypothetical protein B0H17DRAFT_1134780 [Mycena rosella]
MKGIMQHGGGPELPVYAMYCHHLENTRPSLPAFCRRSWGPGQQRQTSDVQIWDLKMGMSKRTHRWSPLLTGLTHQIGADGSEFRRFQFLPFRQPIHARELVPEYLPCLLVFLLEDGKAGRAQRLEDCPVLRVPYIEWSTGIPIKRLSEICEGVETLLYAGGEGATARDFKGIKHEFHHFRHRSAPLEVVST